ncbi:MAG: HAMP domain-containing protein, partial [Nostoc sp.]
MSIIVSHFVNRPIAAIKEGIQQLQAGNYDITVDINANDEFGEIGRAFNAMVINLGEKLGEIDQKNRENEALMLNIVPFTIAQRLKEGELLIADHVKHVTILYARIVGIAELSQRLPPTEIIQLLTRLF